MHPMALYRQSHLRLCGLAVVATWLGCAQPDAAPAFMDPPIACNADLVRGTAYKLVTKQLLLPRPTGGSSYSEDFDGDNKPENQLKHLVSLADLVSFDIRGALDQANQAGEGLLLLQLTSPELVNGQADCASLTVRWAQPPGPSGKPPKFDGTDAFQAASTDVFTFYGRIDSLVFQSLRPRDQAPGVDAPLNLLWPLPPAETVLMPLRGVGVTARLTTDHQNKIVGLTEGAIYGVEPVGAVRALLVPAVAKVVTAAINRAPAGDWRQELITWLEDQKHDEVSQRKCLVTADCCSRAPDTCKILPAEVTASALGGVLTPDVEVFDGDGNWRPSPRGKAANGFSVGIGFEAVPATF